MDRRSFLLSSALSTLHLRVPSGLKRALQNNAANLEDELKIRLSHDSLRPQYHLLPPAGSLVIHVRRDSSATSTMLSFTAISEAEGGTTLSVPTWSTGDTCRLLCRLRRILTIRMALSPEVFYPARMEQALYIPV